MARGSGASGAASAANLTGVKTYLTEHRAKLVGFTDRFRSLAQDYDKLASGVGYDHIRLLSEQRILRGAGVGLISAQTIGLVVLGFSSVFREGTWLGIYPRWQGVVAQVGAVTFVVGSYLAAEHVRTRRRRGVLASVTATR